MHIAEIGWYCHIHIFNLAANSNLFFAKKTFAQMRNILNCV